MFRNKSAMDDLGQCSSTYAPRSPASESPECLLKMQVTMVHRQIYWISGICISVGSQVVLRHREVWEPIVCTDGAAIGSSHSLRKFWDHRKIQLLLQCGRQCETNSNEIAMPFLDQNAFPFSVEKDRHIVKALIFVTEAVPYCFCWFP